MLVNSASVPEHGNLTPVSFVPIIGAAHALTSNRVKETVYIHGRSPSCRHVRRVAVFGVPPTFAYVHWRSLCQTCRDWLHLGYMGGQNSAAFDCFGAQEKPRNSRRGYWL